MTDKQIIIDEINKTIEQEMENLRNIAKQQIGKLEAKLKAKEQECEELKEEIKKHNDDMFKNPPEKRFYCKGCTLPYISKKLKQTLTEIKEIAITGLEGFCPKCSRKECEDNNCIETAIRDILQKISEVSNDMENN